MVDFDREYYHFSIDELEDFKDFIAEYYDKYIFYFDNYDEYILNFFVKLGKNDVCLKFGNDIYVTLTDDCWINVFGQDEYGIVRMNHTTYSSLYFFNFVFTKGAQISFNHENGGHIFPIICLLTDEYIEYLKDIQKILYDRYMNDFAINEEYYDDYYDHITFNFMIGNYNYINYSLLYFINLMLKEHIGPNIPIYLWHINNNPTSPPYKGKICKTLTKCTDKEIFYFLLKVRKNQRIYNELFKDIYNGNNYVYFNFSLTKINDNNKENAEYIIKNCLFENAIFDINYNDKKIYIFKIGERCINYSNKEKIEFIEGGEISNRDIIFNSSKENNLAFPISEDLIESLKLLLNKLEEIKIN